jgi:hypothetical protein
MAFADRLLAARQRQGDGDEIQSLAVSAYEAELAAATLAFERETSVATRMILLRSAAHLAREAKQWESGLDLAIRALQALDLRPYRTELLRILDTLRTYEHLQIEGVELSDTEVQLSMAGPEAAPGFAKAEEVTRRVNDVRKLMIRNSMRRAGLPFDAPQVRGRLFREAFTPYLSLPRAASYALTVRFGVHEQTELDLELAGSVPAPSVADALDDLMQTAKQYARGGLAAIQEIIPDKDYAKATANLLRDLSPDSQRIQTVGLTVFRNGIPDPIALPSRRAFDPPPKSTMPTATDNQALPPADVEVIGRLLEGSAKHPRKAWGTIVEDNGREIQIKYDEAAHGDIIDGYWKHRVRARIIRTKRQQWMLTDIQDA